MSLSKSKGSLSGLEFRVLSREISSSLAGAYVSNIYSLGDSQILRMRKPPGGTETSEASLVLSPRLGPWITEHPAREETSEFTTSLRSYLLRAKLESVSQFDLDRILTLNFAAKPEDSRLQLVLEMMPPGNLVLIGPEGKIVLALRDVKSEGRRISRGHAYAPPTQTRSSLETISREELAGALSREKTLGRALGRGLSIPKRYVDEILDRAGRKQEDSSELSSREVDEIMGAIRAILADLKNPQPCLVRTGEGTVEVMVTRPARKEVVEASPGLSVLLDRFLSPELLTTNVEWSPGAREGPSPDVHERRAQELKTTISDLGSKKTGLARLSADLRGLASQVRAAPDAEAALEIAKASNLLPPNALGSLDSLAAKGQASVASAIFDRAKNTEREIADIETAMAGLQVKLKRESGRAQTARPRTISLSRPKREWYEKFRWFFTTDGKLAVGGRDAQSNSMLIRRHMQEGDTVYHADLFGSPFFILKGGKGQTDLEAKEVAKATVTFSSAWKTGLGAADAYWVDPDQVSTAGPSGEYLAHGSFAIKGKKNFITKNPVELAVGVEEGGRLVSGPEESVMRVSRGHVTLIPSKDKPSDTTKKVLHELGQYADPEVSLTLEDVQRMLPAGGGKIIRRRTDKKAPAE